MIRHFFAALLSLTVAALSISGTAAADVNYFVITDFSADYYLNNADPQGAMRVVEKISVAFTDQNHGILRAIPESYQGHPLHVHINQITSNSGASTQYTTSADNGNEVLRIGDPNRTVTGSQEYTIDYSLENVITFYGDHDEFYWDVNGDQWPQPTTSVHAKLHLPTGLKQWSQTPKCYVGSYGSSASQCTITTSPNLIASNAAGLMPETTLTLVAGFDKGYFHPMTWRDYLHDYGRDALELTIPILFLGGGGFIWWLKRGRDAKGTGVIVPQYDAPDNLSPLEAGTLVDFRVDMRDLTATIIDLAIRKYLRIIENDQTKLLVRKTKSYSLELLNENWDQLNDWERSLMTSLFGASGKGDTVDLSKLKNKLYTTSTTIKKSVSRSMTDRGYFVSNPSKFIAIPVGAVIIFAWILVPAHTPVWLIAGTAIGAAIFALFYHFMPARTAKGVVANEHILGLKMYLQVAEKDRIAKLQSPDAPYAPKTDAPTRTVELFEKLLPYAIVLKVEKQWAKKFEDIYVAPPDWYAGNYSAFSVGYLAGSLSSGFAPAVGTSFSSPSGSGSSGFGGGGFAGGGGGGGGGGGW